jgi:hypothetical protein
MRYAADGYALTGYFLQVEEQLAATAVGTCVGVANADAYSDMALLGSGNTSPQAAGGIASIMSLMGSSFTVSTLIGDVNPSYHYSQAGYAAVGYFLADEAPVLADAFTICQSEGDIYATMDLLGEGYSASACAGDVLSTMGLLGDGFALSAGMGDIYSTQTLLSNAYIVVTTAGRLTFPSLYIGDLGIESLTPIHNIESLTPAHQIGLY